MAVVTMCNQLLRNISFSSQNVFKFFIPNTHRLSQAAFSTLNEGSNRASKEANIDSKTGEDQSASETISPEIKELLTEKEELLSRIQNVNDKYLRALAENENIRTRMTRQIAEAKQFGIQSFCKDLLDVADVLSKATESVPESERNDSNPHLRNLFEGLKMTEAQLQKVFRLHGLTQINPLGERFDPNCHEALFEQPFEGKVPGTVAVVTKIGYRLRDRTIRPAIVGIVKAS